MVLIKVLISSCCQKLSVLYNLWKNVWLQAVWLKKSPQMIEWSSQAAPLRKAKLKKEWPVATSFCKWNNTLPEKWTTGSGVLKKIYFLYKSGMLQIDPLKKQLFLKATVSRKNFKVKSTPKEQLFGESCCSESHTCKCNCLQLLF